MIDNPLLAPWTGPFELPPFATLEPAHFRPAFDVALARHREEVASIAAATVPPTFDNMVAAMERSGRLLNQISLTFSNLAGADTSDALEAIEREMAPLLSRHRSAIYLDETLFVRLDDLWQRRETLGLDPEQARVLERYHTAFLRTGAGKPPEVKARLAEIGVELAALGTQFGQNVLADEKNFMLVLETDEDLAGLPPALVAAAAGAASARGLDGKHAITLSRSSVEPFLQFSARRDLREKAFRAWTSRGEGDSGNLAIAAQMVRLRAERATLLGFESFAEFRIADTMAKTPEAVRDLLDTVWNPARGRALREQEALQAMIAAEGGNFDVAPWDWRYYAEKRRKAEYDLDEAELKPYMQLDKLIEAAFYTANRLFGLDFEERPDITLYHEDARAFAVTRAGRPVGLFIGDYFARPSKHSGAWMNAFRGQRKLDGAVLPVIVNVMNFAEAPDGEKTLLSFDDARTLFHEFGHAMHGMLSDVTYPMIAGTNVARDFVEFPSQLYEHWLERPEILRRFARHAETDAPMPDDLLARLLAARRFNQGFATVEYTASALVDLDLHLERDAAAIDIAAYEKRTLEKLGMPSGIVMRHRPAHFNHVFSGDGYSAGYYSYLWSEILDADGFGAFEEKGDIFDPETAKKLHDFVYAAGNRAEPDAAYAAFRGRAPRSDALLRKRGLVEAPAGDA